MTSTTPANPRWPLATEPPGSERLVIVITENVLGELSRKYANYIDGQWTKPGVIRWIEESYGIFAPPPHDLQDRTWLHKMWPTL